MQSLSSAKQKFLRKSKDGEGPESYSYNLKFASKSKKVFVIWTWLSVWLEYQVRVDQLQIRETKQENVQTNEHIFQVSSAGRLACGRDTRLWQDRQYAIDAAIVRILKVRLRKSVSVWLLTKQARKQLGHTMLISEIFSQLKFPAKPVSLSFVWYWW